MFIPNFFSPWSKTLLPGNTNKDFTGFHTLWRNQYCRFAISIAGWICARAYAEPVFIDTEFGSYKLDIRCEQGTLFYRRSIELKSGVYSPEKYSELVDLFSEMTKRDAERVVFKRSNSL
ncbi:MAG: DUF3858 domain-containing protein [Saprospiraceae bacterium]